MALSACAAAEVTQPVRANLPPVLTIATPSLASVSAVAGDLVAFAATCTDPEGGPVTYAWSFPGGTPAASAAASPGPVAWAAAGTFTVTCLCADAQGARATLTRTVVVAPPLDQPAALRISVAPPAGVDLHQALAPAPEVQLVNAVGDAIAKAGVVVTVAVGGGTGSLAGTLAHATDAAGRAPFDGLSFAGLAAGTRTLRFTAPGLTAVSSAPVVVHPGPATQLRAASAVAQVVGPATLVPDPPAVQLADAEGNPVTGPAVAVSFAVTAGGGTVAGSPATTGVDGVARLGGWTVGSSGAQSVRASAAALPASLVDFTATLRAAGSSYDITLRYLIAPTEAQRQAFERARTRIEQVITGDLPNVSVVRAANPQCGDVALNEVVDDLLILVELSPIDGAGGILGQAGPCYTRSAGGLPLVGFMQFDTADLATLEARGQLDSVILHEMLHVVGFGTVWDVPLLTGAGGTNPEFNGAAAVSAFKNLNGGAAYAAVPVENSGGAGTADGHWRETIFKSELMTGYLSGSSQPLSATTAGSLSDLGYVVDASQADPFNLATALRALDDGPPTPMGPDSFGPIGSIDEQGVLHPAR